MKTIIIPTDFSPTAANALHYGIEMAKVVNASVILFHAYQIPVTISDVPAIIVSPEEVRVAAEERLMSLKKEVEHITSGQLKLETQVRLGNLTDELIELCKTEPFAIIMGTKGSSGLDRILFGSNTLSVVRHLTCPVVCVPQGKQYGMGINKIGFACDFRDIDETTPAQYIKEFVNEFGAELHVLNVDFHPQQLGQDEIPNSELLHKLLEDLTPEYHFIQDKDVEHGINEFAEKNNIDLVITIPKKHKFLENIFKSSSTKQLVFHSHIPVMCVHQ